MIVHYDAELRPQHVVTYASQDYVAMLHGQRDAAFVHLAEDLPVEQIAIERHQETSEIQAFHVPEGGIRREIAQVPFEPDPDRPAVIGRDLEAARASLATQVDAFYGRQAQLRYPLAAIHAVKAQVAVSAPTLLVPEAAERGAKPEDLVAAVHSKADAQAGEILALDAERRAIKREIAAADSLDALDAIAARIGG